MSGRSPSNSDEQESERESDGSSERENAPPPTAATVPNPPTTPTPRNASSPPAAPPTAGSVDARSVIVANNPLPQQDFPSNAPAPADTQLSLAPRPRVLRSVDELQNVIAESRQVLGFSNFAELSTPQNASRVPSFPTFTRFSHTRFANAETDEHKISRSDRSDSGAIYDMVYPIVLSITDSRRMPLPGIPMTGIPDSKGYPLLYNSERPLVNVRSRSSGALYPANLSRAMVPKMSTLPDVLTLKTWAHMFQLSNEKDAQAIILQRVRGSAAGDNHIALLFKAYMAYLDSVAGALDGTVPSRNTFSATGVVVNTATQEGWTTQMLNSACEVVNVLGGSPGYQEFWAYCCFAQPPIFAARTTSKGVTATTLFSHYKMGAGMAMACLCDYDAYSVQRDPEFYGRPNLILGHIEMYVQKFGLQQQANDALQIALLWPTLCETGANVSLPRPYHTTDWLGGEIERPLIESPYQGLIASSPFVVLASTMATAWAMRSQIYDYITLLTSKRNTWQMTPEVIRSSVAWLTAHASAPGIGWDFLLRHHFHVSGTFLYLTGLNNEIVDWGQLLTGFNWKESQFPAHLRLIQPFWTETSVCCRLPWEDPWTPAATMSGYLLTATPATIMCMLRLGLLRELPTDASEAKVDEGIFPILQHGGEETIQIPASSLLQVQAVTQYGIRVLALCSPPSGRDAKQVLSSRDPADSRKAREAWSLGGLLQNLVIHDRGGDAFKAQMMLHRDPGLANRETVDVAGARLSGVKERLAEMALRAAAEASTSLSNPSNSVYKLDEPGPDLPSSVEVVYSPQTSGDCGWWCALFVARATVTPTLSMACLRQSVARLAGENTTRMGTLSVSEMAGLCAVLELPVDYIYSSHYCAVLRQDSAIPSTKRAQKPAPFLLRLADCHWEVVRNAAHASVPNGIGDFNGTNVSNMPANKLVTSEAAQTSHASAEEAEPTVLHSSIPHNIATRVRVLDTMISRFDNGLVPASEVVQVHERLFPDAGIPRFLKKAIKGIAPTAGQLSTGDRPGYTHPSTPGAVQEWLRQTCGQDSLAFLDNYKRSFADKEAAAARCWPFRSIATSGKNNLAVFDLLRTLDVQVAQEALSIWFIWSHEGNHSEFVTSVALWLGGVDLCDLAWSELLSSGLLNKNEDTWLEYSKQLHDDWRKNGLGKCSCDSCWTQLLYPQALYGRGGVTVDWEQEITNKATVPDDIVAYTGQTWSAAFATQIIRQTVREVLSTAADAVHLYSFDDFMDRAYEWLVSGSAAGMPTSFQGTDVLGKLKEHYNIQPRATKRSVMEAIPREHILQQLTSRPQIVAKLHQKLNETGGKARAIYGVTLWHYVFSNWLMAPFEKAIDHPNIDINIRTERLLDIQVRRARGAHQGACFSSYDYPDFNSMHTHNHMSLIYEEAAMIALSSPTCTAMDQAQKDLLQQGYKWLQEAVFTQVCFLPDVEEFIQTVGGLYSGNRDTTLINTILNIAYAKVVDVSCANMGLDPMVNWRLCHGDDIVTQHERYGPALAWNAVASKANLKGQEKKLLTDRSFHEYLRVMGCTDGRLRGALARVVATHVNGNWETDYTAGAFTQMMELQNVFGVFQRRGMRAAFATKLWRTAIQRLMRRIDGVDDDSRKLREALALIMDAAQDGASTSNRPSTTHAPEQGIYEPERREKDEVERLFSTLPDEVTRPYQRLLTEALPSEFQHLDSQAAIRLKTLLQKSTYGTEMPRKFQIETKQTPQLLAYRQTLATVVAKRGKHVKAVDLDDVGRLIDEHRTFSTTMRRIKAFHTLLSALDDLHGFSKLELVAHLCKAPEAVVRNVLTTEGSLSADWRRMRRPSAPEAEALENEVEMFLTNDGVLHPDEEVVLYTDDGLHNRLPVRDLLLY